MFARALGLTQSARAVQETPQYLEVRAPFLTFQVAAKLQATEQQRVVLLI